MKPDDPLLQILACPLDKGQLHLVVPDGPADTEEAEEAEEAAEALYNPRLRRRYPIVDGIPQLLPASGEQVSDDEHEELLKRMAP
ncbi:Trm112 family protein [Streptomyces sp. DT2A-34]|uniref:Trm112 family protein n=1 Tax=Streptomyces sp. DT2A-34 TaxID=3051182 RepID=UPI00265C5818|nr:Trm112 family protein [Streptomyces sp. DT2A-34]MDO0915216.1 Trm112 family protein [Streptomyces sp. DT2A-34]